jgi:hypothetical protein
MGITCLIIIGGREGDDYRVRGAFDLLSAPLDAVRYVMKSDAALRLHSI